jgi:hypothetical protein
MESAYLVWAAMAKRTPSKSHPGVKKPREKKADSASLHELLRATSREAEEEERISGYIDVSDSDDDDPFSASAADDADDADDADAAPRFTSDELIASIGPYQPIPDYTVLPAPAETPAAWLALLRTKQFKWTGKRLAHIFEGGWADASFRGAAKDEQKADAEVPMADDFYVFYYKDTGETLVHDLKLEEYGMHKAWVILQSNN